MLRFLHGFMEQDWPGLVRHGLIDETSGIKFHQSASIRPERRFNDLARRGGMLHGIMVEDRRPFYVDRLQGGSVYYRYDYDPALLREYQDMAGDWFLGFQMHEWASNLLNDWQRITQRMGENPADFSAAAIDKALRMYKGQNAPFLETASPAEYAAMKKPENREQMLAQMDWIFALRQQQTGGCLLPADSYFMAVRQELMGGAKALMPEVGAQIPFMRMQLALTRGMAKVHGVKWGAYYEPWGGEPFGCCFYKDTPENEWDWYGTEDVPFRTYGPTGGSSRALQRRVYYFGLMSGIEFLSEEWGTANTFASWSDYSLSVYGQNKADFLAFAARHRDLGDIVTPAALVLPTDFTVFDLGYLRSEGDSYIGFPLSVDENRRFGHIRRVLKTLLGDGSRKHGNEGHTIGNSAYGDVFDIVYADAGEAALKGYDLLIDLDPDNTLAARVPALAGKVLPSADLPAMETALKAALNELLPMEVAGELSWVLNRAAGGYVLGLFNNEGVRRTVEKGDEFLPEADTTAVITAPGRVLSVLLGDESALHRDGDSWRYDLKAGQPALLTVK